MGVWGAVEKTLGLPPLKEAMQSLRYLAEGETGQRLDRITARLVKLSGDSQGLEALRLLERLDQQGTLQRLDPLLMHLQPLTKFRGLNDLLTNLSAPGQLLEALRLVERLDQQGTLQRLGELAKDVQPLTRSKGLNAMLERLDNLAPLLDKLMKEG